jgi:hypothetical protein
VLLRRVSKMWLIRSKLRVLLPRVETALRVPRLRWRIGTRKRMVSLRFGEVVRMIDGVEGRRLEGPLHLLLWGLYICRSSRLRRHRV